MAKPNLTEKFFTIRQVAEILNVSTRTIRYYIDKGTLKPTRFNGTDTIRIRESDLAKFILP
jgi:excisionase family DNA binding protein